MITTALLFLSAIHFSQAENFSAQFKCYQSVSAFSLERNMFADRKAGIRRLESDPLKFQIITAEKIQQCEVPKGAPIIGGGTKNKGQFNIALRTSTGLHYLSYGEDSTVVQPKEEEKAQFQEAKCRALVGAEAKQAWESILDEKLGKTRQECGPNQDRGMSQEKTCLKDFDYSIQPCKSLAGRIGVYAKELARSAKAEMENRENSLKTTPRSSTVGH